MMRKLLVVCAGLTGTLLALAALGTMLHYLPLPDVAALSDAFWRDHPPAGLGGHLASHLLYALHLLTRVWVVWLVPLGGFLITMLILNRPGTSAEMSVYLERVHLLEEALKQARDSAETLGGHWDLLNRKLDEMFERSADVWMVVDHAKGARRWNRAALDLARRTNPALDTLEGHGLAEILPGAQAAAMLEAVEKCAMEHQVWNREIEAEPLGQWFMAWIFPLGQEVALVLREVTSSHRDDSFLQSSERLARQLVEDSVRPVAVLDAQWRYMFFSRKWHDILGLPHNRPLVGEDHRAVVPDFPHSMRVVEQQLLSGQIVGKEEERRVVDGRELLLTWHIRPWMDALGRLGGYIFTVVDQTEMVRLRQQVGQAADRENALAYSDALTGLPNRQLFNDRLNMALAQAYRQLGKVALLFLDLDGFKAVNDQLGHDYGDLLLKQVAERLKGCVRNSDTVARLGGDEFTIILGIRDRQDAEMVAQKLLATVRAPYDLNGQVVDRIGTSIGIALYPQDGSQAADLIKKADNAMYAAKQGGKNAYRFATVEIKVQG